MTQIPTIGRIVHLVVCNEFGLEIVRHPAIVTYYRPDGRLDMTVFWHGAVPSSLDMVAPKPDTRQANGHHWEWPLREAPAAEEGHPHQIEAHGEAEIDVAFKRPEGAPV